ncbi:uncharacterized protein CC84DRAFT_222439 [Paraphaeosphaeria sporulosa]|uniref:Uncharacterized protein n=1 Tax=Paraphaeosphaeria sporulosa TaxID=1460663 RepID=A0A177C4K8_9PLEO|nr:uncharacterized protein CC84DRAFT_222439 [Paraphaeosphaeria sporulosa]OAG01812.1 hypothetical protein CC84DRAFT_222439 [Paraphaeosphaeria sporulosa]
MGHCTSSLCSRADKGQSQRRRDNRACSHSAHAGGDARGNGSTPATSGRPTSRAAQHHGGTARREALTVARAALLRAAEVVVAVAEIVASKREIAPEAVGVGGAGESVARERRESSRGTGIASGPGTGKRRTARSPGAASNRPCCARRGEGAVGSLHAIWSASEAAKSKGEWADLRVLVSPVCFPAAAESRKAGMPCPLPCVARRGCTRCHCTHSRRGQWRMTGSDRSAAEGAQKGAVRAAPWMDRLRAA